MKIGILQTDNVVDGYEDRFGDYPDMFRELLAGQPQGRMVAYPVYRVHKGELPGRTDECDSYLITGSRRSVYDDEGWIRDLEEFVRRLHEHRRKVCGICFGHQLIGRALGGDAAKSSHGWQVGIQHYRVVGEGGFMVPPLGEFSLIASHKDQVTALPPGGTRIAENAGCPNAAFVLDDHVLTFQSHPEFRREYSRALMTMRRDIIGAEIVEAGMRSLEAPTHEREIAHWILTFLLADGQGAKTAAAEAEQSAADE